ASDDTKILYSWATVECHSPRVKSRSLQVAAIRLKYRQGLTKTMKILRLYIRVLALLGPEARLGWALAIASVSLASAQFIEPVLFGRIVDNLANAQSGTRSVSWSDLLPLVGAWVGFGLFIIVAGTMVALHADRLAHRHSQKVRTDYFEHVLQLPL